MRRVCLGLVLGGFVVALTLGCGSSNTQPKVTAPPTEPPSKAVAPELPKGPK